MKKPLESNGHLYSQQKQEYLKNKCSTMSVCTDYRKSEKQAVKCSNCCLKRENKITDNDEMISGRNEKITYQRIEFPQRRKATVYPNFDTKCSRNKYIVDT